MVVRSYKKSIIIKKIYFDKEEIADLCIVDSKLFMRRWMKLQLSQLFLIVKRE